MKIAREFFWEMGHRLPGHAGKCSNIHGHSYRMRIILEGTEDAGGMLMDFYELKKLISPLLEELDHAFMVRDTDSGMIEALKALHSRMVIVGFESTVENLCRYFLEKISKAGLPANISSVTVRIFETPVAFAEETLELNY